MDSILIKKLAKSCIDSSKCDFLGVYSRDTLPNLSNQSRFPCCFISNTDVSKGKGKHWVVFYFTSVQDLEFFDSLGRCYSYYHFDTLKQLYPKLVSVKRINQRIQSCHSSLCGHYCLFFLFMRSHGHSFYHITDSFCLHDSNWNDKQVSKFIKKNHLIS